MSIASGPLEACGLITTELIVSSDAFLCNCNFLNLPASRTGEPDLLLELLESVYPIGTASRLTGILGSGVVLDIPVISENIESRSRFRSLAFAPITSLLNLSRS
jgi:hypothetical protein